MQELIRADQQQGLWVQWQMHQDREAREALVLAHLPLVHKIVRKMTKHWRMPHNTEDLVGMGTLGLLEAIDRYDSTRGHEFVTFASWRIRGAILDGLRSLDWVPRTLRTRAKEIEAAYALLEHQLLRSAKDEEIAEHLGLSLHEFQQTLYELSVSPLVSLDGLLFGEEADNMTRVSDTIVDPNALQPEASLERANIQKVLAGVLERLPEKERLVITLHYYEEFTFKEIAEVLEISGSRVSQLHTKAIYRLRGALSRRKQELRS